MKTAYELNIKHKKLLSCRCKLVFVSFAAFLLVLLCSVRIPYADQVTLEWSPVIHPDLAGYMIYYGTSSGDYDVSLDVGNWPSVTIAGLDGSETYYFAATAYSIYGDESDFSNEVQWTSTTANNGGGGGSGCFIATAAYGSAIEPHVMVLRDFRDRYLLANSLRHALEDLYYKYSPPMADFIARNDNLRAVVRWSLIPLVAVSWMTLQMGSAPTLAFILLIITGLAGLAGYRRKYRK